MGKILLLGDKYKSKTEFRVKKEQSIQNLHFLSFVTDTIVTGTAAETAKTK